MSLSPVPTFFNSVLKEGENLHLDVSNLRQEDLMLQGIISHLLHFGVWGLYLMQTMSKCRHGHKHACTQPSLVEIQPAGTHFGYLCAKCYTKENTDSWHQVYPGARKSVRIFGWLCTSGMDLGQVAHGFLLSFCFRCFGQVAQGFLLSFYFHCFKGTTKPPLGWDQGRVSDRGLDLRRQPGQRTDPS